MGQKNVFNFRERREERAANPWAYFAKTKILLFIKILY